MKPILHERLSHLSKDEINKLIERYYADEKVSDLLDHYKINVRPSELIYLFPPIITDIICPYCNITMWSDRSSRSSFLKENTPYCPKCKHKPIEHCFCSICVAKRQEQKMLEINRVRKILSESLDLDKLIPTEVYDLSFDELVYTGALLRIGIEEDLSKIKPVNDFIEPLAPTQDFQLEIIKQLYQNEIITIHPNSSIDAFSKVSDDGNYTFNMFRVYYHLNLTSSDDRNTLINQLMNPEKFEDYYEEDAYNLWKRIALEECKEYLLHNLNSVGFEYSIGEKTEKILIDLLQNFSTAQIYGIIWSCTSNATRYYQEKNISKKQAANSVIGNCQRYAEKAISEGWEPKRYNRTKDCPQSALSKFFFNRILQIGDDGFNFSPRIIKGKSFNTEDDNKLH